MHISRFALFPLLLPLLCCCGCGGDPSGQSDLAPADLAPAEDAAAVEDLSPEPDLFTPPDLSTPPDLRRPPDIAVPRDFAVPPDIAVPADLSIPRDLAAPPDLARPDLLTLPFPYYDVNHILSTGQSLSVGAVGAPPLSTAQPYDNRTFNTGVLSGGTNLVSFIPLVESGVETMSSGMANLITFEARARLANLPPPADDHDVLVSCHGVGGQPYSKLKKGTQPYANGMAQASAGADIARQLGKSYVVRAVTTVHGESDHVAQNINYANDLLQWQSDYENDVRALVPQTEPVPMFQTQVSSWTRYGQATSLIPYLQTAASRARPDKVLLVGPKYMLSYVSDGVHLNNHGYRWMGEYYAKAYRRVVIEGKPWTPLWPIQVTRVANEITVVFDVPVPPLVLDTQTIKDPGRFGFEYWDNSGNPPAIISVALAGADRVKVTLASTPGGTARRIRYAYTGIVGANAGPQTGPRGCLRDSDATPSRHGYKLYNWAIHFDEPVP